MPGSVVGPAWCWNLELTERRQMQNRTTGRGGSGRVVGLLLAGMLVVTGGLSGSALHAEHVPNALLETPSPQSAAVIPFEPAKPAITAPMVWSSIESELELSPWLRNADEFAAWVDDTGNRCQEVTGFAADKLRELGFLLNEHWIGKRAAQLIVLAAGGVAAADPVTGVGFAAAGMVVVIKTSGEWTEALATQADDLGAWIEGATEEWERYAAAYEKASESPTAESIAEFMAAAQALRPYLERGEQLVRVLNTLAAEIEGYLVMAEECLEGMDHWTVRWLADNANEHAVSPALDELRSVRPTLQMAQGRLMIDQALVTTLPLRFGHLAIAE